MPVSPMSFQIPTQDQNAAGMSQGMSLAQQFLQSLYAPRQLAAQNQLLQNQAQAQGLQNQLTGAEIPYAGQMNAAKLAQLQEMAPHLQAQTQLLGQQGKYYAPNILSEIASRNAQIPLTQAQTEHQQFLNKNPLLSMSGPAGEFGALSYLKQHPELDVNVGGNGQGDRAGIQFNAPSAPTVGVQGNLPKPLSQSPMPGEPLALNIPSSKLSEGLSNAINQGLQAKTAQGNLALRRAQGYGFTNLPIDTRGYTVAQAQSFGYDPLEASNMLLSGQHTLKSLAEAKGYGSDPSQWPSPMYQPNRTNVAQAQRRTALLSEIDNLNKTMNEWASPYSRTVMGYSPKQLVEAIQGSDPDAQAKFLAARTLAPDLNAARAKVMGSNNPGIEMLRHLGETSNSDFKTFRSLISPEVYKKYNDYVQQALNQGNQRFNDTLLRTKAAESPAEVKASSAKEFSQQDLEHTAKKYNMTVEQVKKQLGAQ